MRSARRRPRRAGSRARSSARRCPRQAASPSSSRRESSIGNRYRSAYHRAIELYLGTFLEVARRRNISRAAEALDLSQTAVSRRVRALETQLGARLFERSGKGVKLTTTGAAFFEHALRISDATRLAIIEAARVAPPEERISPRRQAKRGPKRLR